MKWFLTLIIAFICFLGVSQTKSLKSTQSLQGISEPEEKEGADPDYPKWFFDVTGIGIRGSNYSFLSNIEGVPSTGKYFDIGFGGKFGIGNHFYLNKTRQNLFVRVFWLQVGFIYYDGLALFAGIAQPSIGYNFQITEGFSIQPAIGGGLVLFAPVLNESELCAVLLPEIRFCLKKIDFGLQYSRYVDRDYPQIDDSPTYDYASFSIFLKF